MLQRQLGKCVLVTLSKPKKTKDQVNDLSPVTLLIIVKKILTDISLTQIRTQGAHRSLRDTTDIVWTHRSLIAKAQADITVYVTEIDRTSAFNTINREKLFLMFETIVDEDELRLI